MTDERQRVKEIAEEMLRRAKEPPTPEAFAGTARARHTHYLRAASDALFQDRERHRAAGEPWPDELQEAHERIQGQLAKREAGEPVGELEGPSSARPAA